MIDTNTMTDLGIDEFSSPEVLRVAGCRLALLWLCLLLFGSIRITLWRRLYTDSAGLQVY